MTKLGIRIGPGKQRAVGRVRFDLNFCRTFYPKVMSFHRGHGLTWKSMSLWLAQQAQNSI